MRSDLTLAVRANAVPAAVRQTGYHPRPWGELLSSLPASALWLGPRDALEEDESFLQIIPYILAVSGGKFVYYSRGPKCGEERLHGRLSLGVGGHIGVDDWYEDKSVGLTLFNAGERELVEELGEQRLDCSLAFRGLVYEDTQVVGRVHLGVVGAVTLAAFDPKLVPDQELTDVGLATIEELQAFPTYTRFELWSQLIIPHLPSFLP